MNRTKFSECLQKYNIFFAIVCNFSNGKNETFGDEKLLSTKGFINDFFGSKDKIMKLDESLEGQIMPQSCKQGGLNLLLIKPERSILIGLFYMDKMNNRESKQYKKQINIEVIDSWSQ